MPISDRTQSHVGYHGSISGMGWVRGQKLMIGTSCVLLNVTKQAIGDAGPPQSQSSQEGWYNCSLAAEAVYRSRG